MPRNPTRHTVSTIARDLGVSVATVSYALNDKPGVSASLRARILDHARAVGWTPHSGARALRRGISGNIGLVMGRDPRERSREPFYAAVTAGIESATSARGRELVIRFVQGSLAKQIDVFTAWADQRRVDGVVLLDMVEQDPRPPALVALDMPFSVLGTYTGPGNLVNVKMSEADDCRNVVDHVQRQGYDGVVHLTGPMTFHHEMRRVEEIRNLCDERGLPYTHRAGEYSIESGAEGLDRSALSVSRRPVVIASSDLVAIGVLRAARERGVVVPTDVGIVSWDDSLIAEVSHPALTALSRDPFGGGQHAGELLLGLIDGDVPAATVLRIGPSTLVEREST